MVLVNQKALGGGSVDSRQTSFLWTQDARKSARLFPIDYTNEEFAQLIKATTRDTKRVIQNNPQVRSVLYELLVSDTQRDIPPELNDHRLKPASRDRLKVS